MPLAFGQPNQNRHRSKTAHFHRVVEKASPSLIFIPRARGRSTAMIWLSRRFAEAQLHWTEPQQGAMRDAQ